MSFEHWIIALACFIIFVCAPIMFLWDSTKPKGPRRPRNLGG